MTCNIKLVFGAKEFFLEDVPTTARQLRRHPVVLAALGGSAPARLLLQRAGAAGGGRRVELKDEDCLLDHNVAYEGDVLIAEDGPPTATATASSSSGGSAPISISSGTNPEAVGVDRTGRRAHMLQVCVYMHA